MAHPAIPVRDLIGSRIGRFVIQSKLGGGGMGEVFLAEDLLLKRHVAMKVIRWEHSQDVRFREGLLKEAERASQLDDEHIARIYDVVEERDRIFLVMEYVEGQTLRARLSTPLALDDFFNIAEQCLSGLNAAHQHSLLHCDLKPENLMISGSGVIKILDFGFACHLQTSETKDTISMTLTGGTPRYMAPEVMLGKIPDERADIYSLGVVFYELLAQQPPRRDQPDRIPRKLPAGLHLVIERMLASKPEQRYADCASVVSDLRTIRAGRKPRLGNVPLLNRPFSWRRLSLIPIIAVLGLLLLSNVQWRLSGSRAAAVAGRELVILPFQAADPGDTNSRAFADGLTDTLSAKLGQVTDRYPLDIIPASEVRAQKVFDAQHARTILGATLVLHGNLQRSGSSVRVTYSLVDTRSLRQIDSGVITADAANVFAVQDRVIQEVLGDLDIELAKSDRGRMLSHGTTQAEAYEHYLRGRGYLQQYDRPEKLEYAIAAFEHSTASDPAFALAYAGLGQAYILMYVLEHRPELVAKANGACARAAQLDEQNPGAELCLGMLFNAAGKYELAAQHLESSLKLDNNCDQCYRELSMAYEQLKRPADAESILRRDIQLHPQQWAGYKRLGSFYASLGRYDEAVSAFTQVVKLAPDSIGGYSNLGAVYVVQGNYSDASQALEKSIAIQPTAPALSNLGAAYFYLRKYQDAARTYAQAAELSPNEYEIFGNLAEAYAQIEGSQNESRRNYARALDLAEERLKVNPRDGAVRMDAAVYSAMLGQREKALQYRNAGLKLSAENPQAWHRSALALAQLHEDRRALADLQRALRSGLSASEISNNPAWQRFSAYPEYRRMVRQTQSK
jgi:serine/threonine protein kinase/tetratricopeptide (TPR) repeat protein